jgi:hypothetical protein
MSIDCTRRGQNRGINIYLILVVFLLSFSLRVASRCTGEAGWSEGVRLCACTVKSRLDHGWSESSVLSQYYAKDGIPTKELIEEAEKGLSGQGCPDDAYFLFEGFSIRKLNLNLSCATGKSIHPDDATKVIWSFPYGTFKLRTCFN